MYAVVDIKGLQYKLSKGDQLSVPLFDVEEGTKVDLAEVLLVADGDSVVVGKPYVEGAVVKATVEGSGRHDKIIVFKKKRRKDYSVKKGHRQDYTRLVINDIKVKGASAKKAVKSQGDSNGA